ncbi:uncharacterized protein V6R79_007998 [Siganus canaliculatus]
MARQQLKEAICRYTKDTFEFIDSVETFCGGFSGWVGARKEEMNKISHIRERYDKICQTLESIFRSEKKGEALRKYMKNNMTLKSADSRRAELEKELDAVLQDTLTGLEELHRFLEAVEKLAVTSLHVFEEENQVLHLPEGISLQFVQDVILAGRMIRPLLLEFKRDARVFFLPKLQNITVLFYQLETYIQTSQEICVWFDERRCFVTLITDPVVNVTVDLCEEDVERMQDQMNQLHEIRMDERFRTVFLFHEVSCSYFINEFESRQPRMLQSLEDLEESCVQLDKMNKGEKISSVAGSSVGATGGVLSIVGLALAPVTAGVSSVLTMAGAGLGVTSAINSGVTIAAEMGVNCKYKKKADDDMQALVGYMQSIQESLDKVTSQIDSMVGRGSGRGSEMTEMGLGVGKILVKAGLVGKGIDSIVDTASVLTKLERAGFIAANALFLGMDVFFICKDSISLYKGSESEASKSIRARAALCRSEIESWQKIHDFLCEGLQTSERKQAILDRRFYSERDI